MYMYIYMYILSNRQLVAEQSKPGTLFQIRSLVFLRSHTPCNQLRNPVTFHWRPLLSVTDSAIAQARPPSCKGP